MNGHQKKLVIAIVSVALIIAVVILVLLLDRFFQGDIFESGKTSDEIINDMRARTFNGVEYIPKNIKTLLIIGVDTDDDLIESDDYRTDKQADFLMLVAFDKSAQKAYSIQLNRDTIAPVEQLGLAGKSIGKSDMQLAMAYTFGDGTRTSCENTKRAVSDLFGGLQIDYAISMNFEAVAAINDYVSADGIELTLEEDEDLSSVDPSWTAGSTITLTGNDALKFIRARKDVGDQSNISRMERQRKYIKALSEAMPDDEIITESWIESGFDAVNDDMYMNLSVTEFRELVELLANYEFEQNIVSPEGIADYSGTYARFYADQTSMEDILTTYFYKERYATNAG